MLVATPVLFIDVILKNGINRAILDRLPTLGLADAWLVAGCLFQTVWNLASGRPATENISDYDIFYFDDHDLSIEAEDIAIRNATRCFRDLAVKVDLKNQARVHLWFRNRFGHDCPRLKSSKDDIDRFLVACTCVGVRPDNGSGSGLQVYSPHGLDDLFKGALRPNRLNDHPEQFAAKAASYRSRWPWLSMG
jgi:uncharacterized protein